MTSELSGESVQELQYPVEMSLSSVHKMHIAQCLLKMGLKFNQTNLIGFYRINVSPLLQNIIGHAMEWKNTLGNILADKTKTNLFALEREIKVEREFDKG